MPPFNRFAPSKYKNQLLEPSKPGQTFTELPSVVPATSPNGRTISCGPTHLAISLGQALPYDTDSGTSVGLIEWRDPRKLGGKVQRVDIGFGIGDMVWSETEKGVLGIAGPEVRTCCE